MSKHPPHSLDVEETVIASVFLDGITTIQAALDKKAKACPYNVDALYRLCLPNA